jgi:hypothetical protein
MSKEHATKKKFNWFQIILKVIFQDKGENN